jgi:hypothetical protein
LALSQKPPRESVAEMPHSPTLDSRRVVFNWAEFQKAGTARQPRGILSLMRRRLLSPLLLVAALAGQPKPDDQIVAKLASDLLPLKLAVASDEPLKDDVYTHTELQSVETYSQSQTMKAFEKDLREFRFQRHPRRPNPSTGIVVIRPLIGSDQGYKLAYVLTGKDLSEANLSPLVGALMGILDSAAVCSDTRAPLQNSAEFRAAAENARNALEALGVSKHDVHIVMDSLFRGAVHAASPPPTFKYQ